MGVEAWSMQCNDGAEGQACPGMCCGGACAELYALTT
eukprot:CAMPEP_0202857648 /NCGR_PEP_ID=MMETSP1391-20130828/510_1 /ASSEMBLY_ACC=CAM_ASM_000867 /TAXON_ID=1034604 /ORGANISM="Chlamydomonas leiostraca, Strain SAG 11-49" /LENGTH=36 /DNA_ID= /DNA_START= /DNA_END= /DNA_ORIENTATION=